MAREASRAQVGFLNWVAYGAIGGHLPTEILGIIARELNDEAEVES
jgi:hypothetical protein